MFPTPARPTVHTNRPSRQGDRNDPGEETAGGHVRESGRDVRESLLPALSPPVRCALLGSLVSEGSWGERLVCRVSLSPDLRGPHGVLRKIKQSLSAIGTSGTKLRRNPGPSPLKCQFLEDPRDFGVGESSQTNLGGRRPFGRWISVGSERSELSFKSTVTIRTMTEHRLFLSPTGSPSEALDKTWCIRSAPEHPTHLVLG